MKVHVVYKMYKKTQSKINITRILRLKIKNLSLQVVLQTVESLKTENTEFN